MIQKYKNGTVQENVIAWKIVQRQFSKLKDFAFLEN